MWRRWLQQLQRSDERRNLPSGELAAAVLLLECARADFDSEPAEIAAVRDALAEQFEVAPEALDALIGSAVREGRQAVSLHDYVNRLNQDLSPDDKRSLIGRLWRVAWADGRIDPQEEALMRRLADLLYVPHADLIRTKLGAREDLAT